MKTRKSTACLRCGNQRSVHHLPETDGAEGDLQEMLSSTFHVLQTQYLETLPATLDS